VINGQLVLPALIECPQLRLGKRLATFIIDTGSNQSLLSETTVKALQISLSGRAAEGHVRFGGATYDTVPLPTITFYLLLDDLKTSHRIQVSLDAIRSHRIAKEKREAAEALPSILGIDFLEAQGFSLHYLAREKLAYLEFD
jgi:hypothetical protein